MPPNPSPNHHTPATQAKDATRAIFTVRRLRSAIPMANWVSPKMVFHRATSRERKWAMWVIDEAMT